MTNETERKSTTAIRRKVEANEAAYRETMREPHARYVAARRKADEEFNAATEGMIGTAEGDPDYDKVQAAEQERAGAVREAWYRLTAIDNEAQEVRRIADFEAWEG